MSIKTEQQVIFFMAGNSYKPSYMNAKVKVKYCKVKPIIKQK